jgi:trans-aconitate methyltransferase
MNRRDAGTQTWDADDYARTAGFVPRLGAPLVDRLDPRPGKLVLDVGCGDGGLTESLAARGAAVVAIDSSPEMVAAARARGLDARLADIEALELPERFDAAFSNAVLHWVRDHDAAASAVARHLKPGGRFVGELGGHGNVAAIVTAILAVLDRHGIDGLALNPWHFPTPAAFGAALERAGFRVEDIALVPRPTPLDAGMAAWLGTFAGAFLRAFPEDAREAVVREIESLLASSLRDERGQWTADYVRLRFTAVRSAG